MTINDLLTIAGLTANDELPAWDAEAAANGHSKKITAQSLANSVKTLASLIASADLDAAPTQGSAAAVQSGGVYNAIQQATNGAIKRTFAFDVAPGTTVQLLFDSVSTYSFLLASVGVSRLDSVGVLYFVNGYVTASRGVALELGQPSIITVDMTADSKTISITNNRSATIQLAVIPLDEYSNNYRI